MTKIFIASDHAGFALKGALSQFLSEQGHEVVDMGARSFIEGDNYPDYVLPCAKRVAEETGSFGIVIGASGQGEAMVANRVSGARAAVYYGQASAPQLDSAGNMFSIISSVRAHNDANILSLGARFISIDEAKDAVREFLDTPFSEDARHKERLAKF